MSRCVSYQLKAGNQTLVLHIELSRLLQAGARIHPNLDPAHIVLGIKEPPLNELITSPVSSLHTASSTPPVPRTHLMFSHTTKGQPYNMELLSRFLSQDPRRHLPSRLIDYELLTGPDGKRTVAFGWFAGGGNFSNITQAPWR